MNKRRNSNTNKTLLYFATGLAVLILYASFGLRQSTIALNSPDSKYTAIVTLPTYMLSRIYMPIYFIKGHNGVVTEIKFKDNASGITNKIYMKDMGYIDDKNSSILSIGNPRVKWVSNEKFEFIYTEMQPEVLNNYQVIGCDINKGCSELNICCE